MLAVNGYYDGNVCVLDEQVANVKHYKCVPDLKLDVFKVE